MSSPVDVAVVDDDQGMREAVEGLIASHGHTVRCFRSAIDYLADASSWRFTCLILDVHMPGMSGLELQQILNAASVRPAIIFLTSYADEQTRARAMAGGARCVLTKPVQVGQLIACVENVLLEGEPPSQ